MQSRAPLGLGKFHVVVLVIVKPRKTWRLLEFYRGILQEWKFLEQGYWSVRQILGPDARDKLKKLLGKRFISPRSPPGTSI